MLKVFHKHQKSVPVIILALLACVSMLPFGTGMGGGGTRDAYAIKVNGQEVSQSDFNLVKSSLENLYRQQFGDYYNQLIQSANLNITQQALDRLIESELLRQFNQKQGLAPSEAAIEQQIRRFFGGEYSQTQLATFLRNTGQTPQQLRSRLELDLQTTLTREMLSDFSKLSDKEITAQITKQETAYNYHLAKFIPENFKDKVAKPGKEDLQAFYDDRVADYEVPEKVQYDYIFFDPAENLDLVEVDLDQIELYYSENQSRFIVPEKVKVSQIILKDAETDATKLVEELNSGADFTELAKKHSTDPELAKASWKSRGEEAIEFEEVAFSGQIGSAEIITTAENTRIIRVEDYQAETTQPLEEVRSEIESNLQKQDVAAFLLIKVEDLLVEAVESGKSLADIATSEGLTVQSTELVMAEQDPNAQAVGLSAGVMANNQQSLQLREVKEDVYLVEVKEYQAARYPELTEIKADLVTAWQAEQADEAASDAAREFLDGT